MADEKVIIEIELDDGSVRKGFVKVAKEAEKTADKVERSFKSSLRNAFAGGSKAIKGITGQIFNLRNAVIGAGGALATFFTFREAIQASARQQVAINNLNTALRLAGDNVAVASQQVQAFASELQQVSTIGDETSIELFNLARTFTTSSDEAIKLTRAAVELNAATGISLDSAVKNLGKTFAGLTGELGESLPALRNLSKEALQSGEALDFVLARFGGAAAAQTKTFAGALEQLQNVFGDFLETVGDVVTKSPALIRIFNSLSTFFVDLSKNIKGANKETGDLLGTLILQFIKFAEAVNLYFVLPLEIAVNVGKAAFQTIVAGINQVIAAFVNVVGKLIDNPVIRRLLGEDSDLIKGLRALGASTNSVAEESAVNANAAFKNLFNTDVFSGGDAFLQQFKSIVDQVPAIAKAATDEYVKVTEDNMKKAAVAVQVSAEQSKKLLVGTISSGFQAVGKVLVNGGNAFEAFSKAALGVIGGFAVQLGQTIIASAIAIEALQKSLLTFGGAGLAIAAGIGLIIVGSALQALSGGPAGAPAGGGGVTATEPVAGEVSPTLDEPEEIDQTTQVAINVEGTVLDPVGVGLQISEVLQETFNATGKRLVTT